MIAKSTARALLMVFLLCGFSMSMSSQRGEMSDRGKRPARGETSDSGDASDGGETSDGADAGGAPKDSCTSFCLDNDGHAVFGTNYDYGGDIDEGLIFVNKRNVSKSYWETEPAGEPARWQSRYGSVTFNLVMSQFVWAGMNEAGLMVSTMELAGSQSPDPDERPWLYSNMWLQYLLDSYRTVDEVIASDSMVRILDYVDHYLVCERTGKCATIELLEGKMVHHTGENLPVRVLANSRYEESVAEWNGYRKQKASGAAVSIGDPLVLRFVLAAERTKEFKPTDSRAAVEYAFDTLAEVSGQKVHGSPTHWSIVFDAKNLRVSFRTARHPEIRYIDFQDLDFSCGTPVKMLDIHEKFAGDLADELRVYSTEFHLEHALDAWKKWGENRSPESLMKEIRYIESFPCE
jgi:choloylglycine hydrolase